MQLPVIPSNEIERLRALSKINLNGKEVIERFDKFIDVLSYALKVPIAYLSSIGECKQFIHASSGIDFPISERKDSFCSHTINQTVPLIIEDTLEDIRFYNSPLVVQSPHIRYYAGIPLITVDGYAVGSVCIADTSPRKLKEQELKVFSDFGILAHDHFFRKEVLEIPVIKEPSEKVFLKKEANSNQDSLFRKIFGKYLSESLLQSLIDNQRNLELGGVEVYATVLISDLRGFTPLSEKIGAKAVVDVLNIYLEAMIETIHAHGGYVNEILGDGMLVVFGVPTKMDHDALAAIQCANSMHHKLSMVNERLQKMRLPPLEMGIGINSGRLIAGNIGSKKRMKYGVVGSTVNVAARIESLTVGGQTLVSERTYQEVHHLLRAQGKLRVKIKGIEHSVTIYDLSTLET